GGPPDVGERPRVMRRPGVREAWRRGPADTVIAVGQMTGHVDRDLTLFAGQLAGAGVVVLLVGLVGGAAVSGRVLRPIADIAATASRISASNLAERIDPSRIDAELASLAGVLNATFDRLQAAFDRQARFTADASHELRTPLAVIRSQAELMLMRPREAGEYRDALEVCGRASRRMAAVVADLLVLARADAARLELRRDPVALDRVVAEATELVGPLARERGVTVEVEASPVLVAGDAEALARVAGTLLSNAVAYNRAGGRVRVSLAREDGEAVLRVEDTGVGIAAEHLPRLFERFYRADPARSGGGTGLGLAICRAMAEAHGGRVTVTSDPGVGTAFTVRLPAQVAGMPYFSGVS
ncbi:MAG: sensor histidine kinase, partial [Gemmataceae bacterium]